jgi:hypothetical protein
MMPPPTTSIRDAKETRRKTMVKQLLTTPSLPVSSMSQLFMLVDEEGDSVATVPPTVRENRWNQSGLWSSSLSSQDQEEIETVSLASSSSSRSSKGIDFSKFPADLTMETTITPTSNRRDLLQDQKAQSVRTLLGRARRTDALISVPPKAALVQSNKDRSRRSSLDTAYLLAEIKSQERAKSATPLAVALEKVLHMSFADHGSKEVTLNQNNRRRRNSAVEGAGPQRRVSVVAMGA